MRIVDFDDVRLKIKTLIRLGTSHINSPVLPPQAIPRQRRWPDMGRGVAMLHKM